MGPIVPSRGLRQGVPISPYLFLACAEAFSALIRKFEERKWLHGCKVANGAPSVSHMLFVDDSFLYCKATNGEMNRVLQLLRMFATAMGQHVNFGKSSVFFSTNTSSHLQQAICATLGIHEATEHRMEVLIKSVVQSLPAYTMNVFLIPVGICQDIERAITKFWWRSNKNKGIHWLSWDKLTKHKSNGGMGFRDLRDFNLALLAKQGWRLLTCGNSLMGKIYKARYFSVFETKEFVRAGVRRLVGDGSTVNILSEPWLPNEMNPYIESVHPRLVGKSVDSLMKVGLVEWDGEVLADVLTARDQALVWKIPLSSHMNFDLWYWLHDASGVFTVKSAYSLLQSMKSNRDIPDSPGFWRLLWQLQLPPKLLEQGSNYCLAPDAILFSSWFEAGLGSWNTAEALEAGMVCWSIWTHRNELVWNSKHPDAREVVAMAQLNYVDWFNVQKLNATDVSLSGPTALPVEQWTTPDFPFVKVNVDGALFADQGRYGLGLIARSAAAWVLGARSLSREGALQPHIVEAIGIKEALSWSKANGWSHVVVESDCLRVINDL
ncbi:uncharacterized protein LOC115718807 [Cannabis sativa]|uniref:uncharacterized protein LOC115718807 n=1 Tax=Cannabis sativa TaxID=3483 RepID=UPI0011DFD6AA|nr:uncharacterized protein LOC115718807 [Cannabis sativa]